MVNNKDYQLLTIYFFATNQKRKTDWDKKGL